MSVFLTGQPQTKKALAPEMPPPRNVTFEFRVGTASQDTGPEPFSSDSQGVVGDD